ncbi:MAG TPA: Bax inhibitor-1/YccA family protein [Alphaproteobacteria bacterium]
MFENNENSFMQSGTAFAQSKSFDEGLRAHMIRIYNTVAAGLGVSGAVAYAVATIPALAAFFMQPAVAIGLGIGILLFLWFGLNPSKMMQQSVASLQVKYYLFTAAMGASLAYVFLAYTTESLARVFFITAGMFLGMSLYGYTTKRDLTSFGSFFMMGLIGLIIASLVNIFLQSTGMAFVISCIGVLLFTGLIAFDTQNAKRMYASAAGEETNHKLAIFNAISLYLNFINLMQFLLRIMGDRR